MATTSQTPPAPADTLPQWNMTVVYPALDSPEFAAGFSEVVNGINELAILFDAEGVGQPDTADLDQRTIEAFDRVLSTLNDLLDQVETLDSYLTALVSTNSRDALAQARMSELQQHRILLAKLGTRFTAWVGTLDVDKLIERSPLARDHAFPLRRIAHEATHQMSPEEEALAAELSPSGGIAWSKLHDNLTSQIAVDIELDSTRRTLSMTEIRNLAHDPNPEVRRAAYDAELAAWEANALALAAALNGVKGQDNVFSVRRRWDEPLDQALFANHIDRPTLDAMLSAARDAFPDFRRYLRAKARALGNDTLPWSDLFAPIGEAGRCWTFAEAISFLETQFGTYSDRMRGLATRASKECWIDAEPKDGKRGGAYCIHLRGDESRIFMNFAPSFDSVETLAHELGHAYHNLNEADLTVLQRRTPATFAETASTFCETLIRQAVFANGDPSDHLLVLEQSLQGSCQVVVDITSRFLFERAVFERRKERELSVDELNQIMLDAQRETYGDGLDPDLLHPYMWAVKGHYYIPGFSFYNFPYMFGLLFGIGLYARYRDDPEGFRTGYDDLLASTGQADSNDLADRFGINLTDTLFWRSSLDVIRADIDLFEQLIDRQS